MDMREMVAKVKAGEPLYGKSDMSAYHQGVAARNSRYSALLMHIVPWANFANHNQVSRGLTAIVNHLTNSSTVWIQQNIISKPRENWMLKARGRHELNNCHFYHISKPRSNSTRCLNCTY